MSVDAFDVSGAAQVAGRIETELIFAAGATERSDWKRPTDFYISNFRDVY